VKNEDFSFLINFLQTTGILATRFERTPLVTMKLYLFSLYFSILQLYQFLSLLPRQEQLLREFLYGSITEISQETPLLTPSLFHASMLSTEESTLETSLHSRSFSLFLLELRTSVSQW
jgi:hypothetical protein